MSTTDIVWLSVDPVRHKVDFYPKAISLRIEKSFSERNRYNAGQCVLGKDFFNATIHFHPNGALYQTTPGVSMGYRGVLNSPGFGAFYGVLFRKWRSKNICKIMSWRIAYCR